MRDPRPAKQESPDLLVELGGWFDQLAAAELRAVSCQRPVFVAHRLALVSGTDVEDLCRLATARMVLANLGASPTPLELPDGVSRSASGSHRIRFHDTRHRLSDADRRAIISAVWRSRTNPRVDLDHPEHDFHVYVTDDRLWFGELLATCAPTLRARAEQRRRPFARSYELPPRKARVLVNMSGAMPGAPFLDPFCGTGSLVIEAARMGCIAVGSDLEIRAASGARRNAAFDNATASFAAADARRLPFAPQTKFAAAAADLPYGRSASRRASLGPDLYVAALTELRPILVTGGRAALMALAQDLPERCPDGWELEWSCVEHARSVDRSIAVWRSA